MKQWDADSFERILTLDGHHGEIWSLAVSPNSRFVVTSGHDKSLRLWERTEEVRVVILIQASEASYGIITRLKKAVVCSTTPPRALVLAAPKGVQSVRLA